jgi:RecB family exonuclease
MNENATPHGDSRPHISPSQLSMAGKCPAQYEFRYIRKIIKPPGISMLKGTGVHAAAEVNYRQKIETREDVPVDYAMEVASDAFDAKAEDGVDFTTDEKLGGTVAAMGSAKDATMRMTEFHILEQAPDYQPTHVEERITVPINGRADLLGIIDLLDDQHRVTDLKTGVKSKPKDAADTSLQLTAYHVMVASLTGTPPTELRLDTVLDQKRGCKRQVLSTTREHRDIRVLANRINALNAMIASGSFPPTDPSAWWCSKRWCGYAGMCKYHSGR